MGQGDSDYSRSVLVSLRSRASASYILSESARLSPMKIFPGRLNLRLHLYALVLVLSHLC